MSHPKTLMAGLALVFLVQLSGAAWAQSGADYSAAVNSSGRELFSRGQYRAAYEALQIRIQAGDAEAVFYALIIRRNGLDGRAPANRTETAALWKLLHSQTGPMTQALSDSLVPTEVKDAYRTALAQLEYFGETPPPWPPLLHDPDRAKKIGSATRHIGGFTSRFGPARNFLAFLRLTTAGEKPKEVFKLMETGAETGDALAMGNLAFLFRNGIGTEKNNIRAAHWARQGSGGTEPPVSRNLNEVGYCYEAGLGVTQDLDEAARWYERSAAQGHPAGRVNVQRLKQKSEAQPALDNAILF